MATTIAAGCLWARDVAIAKGVTINGLVILTETPTHSDSSHTNPPGGLANYYRNNVIGGPGAFVMVAENFNSFGNEHIGGESIGGHGGKAAAKMRENKNSQAA